MKRNTPNSQDKNRNNNNTNNNRNKNGRDSNPATNHNSKECSSKCKSANSCASANKTVEDIERYTREAENLVDALSALTKLAEQLVPCIATKSQCSQSGPLSADVNFIEDDSIGTPSLQEEEDVDSDPRIPVVTKRSEQEDPKVIPKVRSEPERVKPVEGDKDLCLCCCSSLQQNNIKDNKPKSKKDHEAGCCPKRKPKETQEKCVKEKPAKVPDDIIELKPLPMPPMTIVHPVESPKLITLYPALNCIEDEAITTYPTVPATTTKAAMNLEDKEVQVGGAEGEGTEKAIMTDPAKAACGKTKECATCCPLDGENKLGVRDVGTDKGAITLNAIPFEEYAEKDCFQYWYDDAATHCKCSSTTDIDSKPKPQAPPPNTSILFPQPPNSSSPLAQPEPQKQQPNYPQCSKQPQQQQQQPCPSSVMDCYPYYHGGQQSPQPYQQQFSQQPPQNQPLDYSEYRNMDPKDASQMYQNPKPMGINAANYSPPGGVTYRACRVKGSANVLPKMSGYEDIDCIPSCQHPESYNPVGVYSTPQDVNQPEYSRPLVNNKKVVQYEDQRYYITHPQGNPQQQMHYPNDSFSPCYEHIPQRFETMGRPQDNYPPNRNINGPPRAPYQMQLNNLMGQPYNTLFVGKPDKDTEDRVKKSDKNGPSPNTDQCSGSCNHQNKMMVKRK